MTCSREMSWTLGWAGLGRRRLDRTTPCAGLWLLRYIHDGPGPHDRSLDVFARRRMVLIFQTSE